MERKRITCPQTAHLEEIDVEPTPYGLVLAGCSRFEPRCAVACERECVRRLDRKDHIEENRERVLVVYGGASWTRPVATALAALLARDGLVAELADADTRAAPPPADYDAIVIGSPQRLGRSARAIAAYVAHHRDALAAMPAFWFAIGRSRLPNPGRMRRTTGWLPAHSFAIVRPSRRVRWFGDPDAGLGPEIREIAVAIADDIPAREPEAP